MTKTVILSTRISEKIHNTIKNICFYKKMSFHDVIIEAMYFKYRQDNHFKEIKKTLRDVYKDMMKRRYRRMITELMHDFHIGNNYLRRILTIARDSVILDDKIDMDKIKEIIKLAEKEYKQYDAKTKKLCKKDIGFIRSLKTEQQIKMIFRKKNRVRGIKCKRTCLVSVGYAITNGNTAE